MLKIIVAVVLLVSAGSGWFYLDYLNKQEQIAAQELRLSVEKNRAQAAAAEQARLAAKLAFETKLNTELKTCLDATQQANTDFLTANQKPVPRKAGQFSVPQLALDSAAQTLATSTADCQLKFEQELSVGSN